MRTRKQDVSAHIFRSCYWFLEVAQKGNLKIIYWHFFWQNHRSFKYQCIFLDFVLINYPHLARGLKGPPSPAQKLEVGGHRPPYLLVFIYTIYWKSKCNQLSAHYYLLEVSPIENLDISHIITVLSHQYWLTIEMNFSQKVNYWGPTNSWKNVAQSVLIYVHPRSL